MIALLAKLPVKAGSEADFEAAFLELAAAVKANEPGNKLYELCRGDDGYTVMELYDDDEALAAHGASDHYKSLGAKLGPFMAGKPELTKLDVVG